MESSSRRTIVAAASVLGLAALALVVASDSASVSTTAPSSALELADGTAPARQETPFSYRSSVVVVDWLEAPDAEAEAKEAAELAERWIPAIEELAFGARGEARRRPIEILLHGDARIGDPPRYRVPHVDAAGVVHLYQYGTSHLAALPHELVHAVLRRENVPYGRFDEEGVATYLGFGLRPSFPGFPAYDHPIDVIAGHWITSGNAIPLTALRARHRELNLKCSFQGYALRASFFLHLGERHGADAIRRFVARMGDERGYPEVFGSRLDELENGWREAIVESFAARPDAGDLIANYLRQPAVANAYVCRPGRDF